jgi:hypothetical protein
MFSCMASGMLEARHTKTVAPVGRHLVSQSWEKLRRTKIRAITQTRGLNLRDKAANDYASQDSSIYNT